MTGVVQGGWEFVTAAYVVSALVLFGYAAAVARAYRVERSKEE